MNFLWNRVFDHFRDRARGALFITIFALFLGVMIVGIIVGQVLGEEGARDCVLILLSVLGIVCGIRLILFIRRARARRLNRYKISPLSRDEICKARSKLMRKQHS